MQKMLPPFINSIILHVISHRKLNLQHISVTDGETNLSSALQRGDVFAHMLLEPTLNFTESLYITFFPPFSHLLSRKAVKAFPVAAPRARRWLRVCAFFTLPPTLTRPDEKLSSLEVLPVISFFLLR